MSIRAGCGGGRVCASVSAGARQMAAGDVAAAKKEGIATLDKEYQLFSEQKPDALANEVFDIP